MPIDTTTARRAASASPLSRLTWLICIISISLAAIAVFACERARGGKKTEEERVIIKSIEVGALGNNCYMIADDETKETIVVDPGDEPEMILDMIEKNGFKVTYIVITHGHFDHVGAVGDIKGRTGAKVMMHGDDLPVYETAREQGMIWGFDVDDLPKPDMLVAEGDKISIGKTEFTVLHTPGHSPGGICLLGGGVVITGDTLFAGSVGRTDFPGGDMKALKRSFNRLMELPEDTKVFAGHGPASTIGREKRENFFAHE